MDEGANRIGNLPDVILQRILSFLPTNDVVKTSILSKRWRYHWMSIPNLKFEQGVLEKRKLFMNFVEKVLLFHDSSNTRNFSLSCEVLSDASRILAWIFAVVRHKVQQLDLQFNNFEKPFVLPHCLFACESLTLLKLCMDHHLKLPSFISSSSLQILTLRNVILPDDHSMQKLLSGCPVLKELKIFDCSWENVKEVCFSAPMLRKLAIRDKRDDQNNTSGCQVVIFGTSLKSFSFAGVLRNDYFLLNASSLVDACVKSGKRRNVMDEIPREFAYRGHKLFSGLFNVKSLMLNNEVVEVLSSAEEFFAHVPVFSKLTCLELDWLVPTDFTYEALLKILQNSPSLEALEFPAGVFLLITEGNNDWLLDPVPPCFSTHLKTIKIGDYCSCHCGNDEQLHAVKILLENAAVLERIVVTVNYHSKFEFRGGLKKQLEVEEQLQKLPRAPIVRWCLSEPFLCLNFELLVASYSITY